MSQPILRRKTVEPDFGISAAAGLAPGYAVVNKFGRNTDVDTAEEDIWDGGGNYNWLSSATQMQVSSSSATDTSAGNGARTIRIEGLDENFDSATLDFTMNGQSIVTTGTTTFIRVFRAYLLTVGTDEDNAGDIYIYDDGGTATAGVPDDLTTVRSKISAGIGQTLMAVYTVPAGKTGYIMAYYASIGRASPTTVLADHLLKTRVDASSSTAPIRTKHNIGQAISATNPFQLRFDVPITVPEKTDVWIRSVASANNTEINAGFEMILRDN